MGEDVTRRKEKTIILRQKHTLDLFLERHAIDQRQYDKSIAEMKEKMGIDPES